MVKPGASALDATALEELMAGMSEQRWRAAQVRDALWQPHVTGFGEVAQFSAILRQKLEAALSFNTVEIAAQTEADSGRTIKVLSRFGDGNTVETVVMESPATERSRRRATVCVSSQVGCAVGCPFCATGQMGLRRNCSAAEIIDQVRVARRILAEHHTGPLTNVVYMGMGEPLANYEAVVTSLRVLTNDAGLSARHLTVSTSGVAPAIDRLATEGMPVTLALSLHAATDQLRDRLVPLNRRYPLETVIAACRRYFDATGRRLTLEWCLIGDVNDSVEQARGLRDLAYSLRAHVNVIPMNEIEGSPWGPPSEARTREFMANLRAVTATVRDTRGSEADAACGQLRAALEQRRWLGPDGSLTAPGKKPKS